jgi:hypothetical protein
MPHKMIEEHLQKAIHDQLQDDERPEGHMGFNTFEEAAFENGIVKTMLTITQDTRTGQWPALSGYFALQLMWHLTKTGTSDERRALLKELMDHNGLEIILDVCAFSLSMVVFFWIILICTPLW